MLGCDPNMILSIPDLITSLTTLKCPCCNGSLHRDDQRDSIYINCHHCETFEFSGFRDMDSGKMVLAYYNDAREGTVDDGVLDSLEKVLYRRTY
jgi:hypothetical protein